MGKIKLIILSFLFVIFAKSQTREIDSLKAIINSEVNDSVKLKAYARLTGKYMRNDIEKTREYITKSIKLSLSSKNHLFYGNTLIQSGNAHYLQADFKSALMDYKRADSVFESVNNPRGRSLALSNIALIYINYADYAKGLEYNMKSIEIREKINDYNGLAYNYNAVAVVYENLNDFDRAIEYQTKSLKLNQQTQNKIGMLNNYLNIGLIYKKTNQFSKAFSCYQSALKVAEEINDKVGQAETFASMGELKLLAKEYNIALKYFEKSMVKEIEVNNKLGISNTKKFMAEVYEKQGNSNLALKYYKEALDLVDEIGAESLKYEIHYSLYNLYKQRGDISNALQQLELYSQTKDTLNSANNTRTVNELKERFDIESKEKELTLLKQESELKNLEQQKEKQKKNFMLISSFVAIVFLAVIIVIVLGRYRSNKRNNLKLQDAYVIIQGKQKEIIDSINYAKRIQDSLLDNYDLIERYFEDSFIMNRPKDIVSGDFYWVSKKQTRMQSKTNNEETICEHFFIAVCDSTGHGVPGGFMSLLNMAYLSEAVNEKAIYDPGKVFDYVRERLITTISRKDQKDGFDGVLLRFDKIQRYVGRERKEVEFNLVYAAAYNRPLLVRNNELVALETDKMPVGYGERNQNFSAHSLTLSKGDAVYVYTDGYADQFGGDRGKKFKYRQLNDLLIQLSGSPMKVQHDILDEIFTVWKDNLEQVDDVCVVGIRI